MQDVKTLLCPQNSPIFCGCTLPANLGMPFTLGTPAFSWASATLVTQLSLSQAHGARQTQNKSPELPLMWVTKVEKTVETKHGEVEWGSGGQDCCSLCGCLPPPPTSWPLSWRKAGGGEGTCVSPWNRTSCGHQCQEAPEGEGAWGGGGGEHQSRFPERPGCGATTHTTEQPSAGGPRTRTTSSRPMAARASASALRVAPLPSWTAQSLSRAEAGPGLRAMVSTASAW